MAEHSRKTRTDTPETSQGSPKGASVDALASEALSMVAKRNAKTVQNIDLAIAARLRDAAAESANNPVPEVLADMLNAGISPETIATIYIPHAARQMGDDWCDDTLSFARVTIGTARLQSSLRTLGADWASHGYNDDPANDKGVVAVVVKDAFHTLGAMVLCGQLRRMGLSVRLALGASTQDLRAIFATTRFDAALISASSSESLEGLKDCVGLIRQYSEICPKIIVGGNVLDQEADVQKFTGADFTTKDPLEALKLCGIDDKARSDAPQQKRRT